MEVTAIDYVYLGDRVSEGEGPQASPILVTKSSRSKAVTADILPVKGAGHPPGEGGRPPPGHPRPGEGGGRS